MILINHMNKKIAWLSGISVLATIGVVTTAQAVSVESGSNKVSVYSCVQVGNDIKVRRVVSDSEYVLTSTCRDAGHGKRQYSMKCNSNKEYQVSWAACATSNSNDVPESVVDAQSPVLTISASALKDTFTNNMYSYRVTVSAVDSKSNIKGVWVAVRKTDGSLVQEWWLENKNGLSVSETGFGSKNVVKSVVKTGLKVGEHYKVYARAYDVKNNISSNVTASGELYVASSDTVAPTIDANVSFASVWDVGYKSKRFVPTVSATASDNVKVTKIVLYHNTTSMGEGYNVVKTCENNNGLTNCSHTFGALQRGNFYAQAWDAAGNSVTSIKYAF